MGAASIRLHEATFWCKLMPNRSLALNVNTRL
jgi:hypothetical protein